MEQVLENALVGALKAYILYIPEVLDGERLPPIFQSWELDTENLLRDANLIGAAHFLREIYQQAISTFENEAEKDLYVNNLQGLIRAIVRVQIK